MIPVRITIHSEGSDKDQKPITLVAFGQLQEMGGTTNVRYEESEVTGMEGTKTTLKWTDDSFTVIRHGSYEHRQQYERGRNSSFQYRTPYFTVPMVVFTRSLDICKQEKHWHVHLWYDIEMDGQACGTNHLTIEIEEEEQRGHETSLGRSNHICRAKGH